MSGLVGREAELGAVADLLTSARSDVAALFLEGDPGIGKTTVWLAALTVARRSGFRVLTARPTAAESVLGYASLADLLSGADPATWMDLPEPQRLGVDQVMLRASPNDAATDPRAVATGFLSVVTRLSDASPVLLAVDDMQWLDSSSMAVLTFVARRLAAPVALLGTARRDPAGNHAVTQMQLDGPAHVRRIRLCPFGLEGIRAVVAEGLGRSIARPTMVRLHQISGGNPFYALELARAMSDEPGCTEMPLPTTLSDLLQTRFSGLHPDARAALLAAASMSLPTVELVARTMGVDADRVVETLESPEVTGIIGIRGGAIRFVHPLLAWGAYTAADPAVRRMMHRRLSDIVDEPEPRARHLAMAATGPDERTVQSLDTAAESARLRGAPVAAAELIELAIALGADTAERRISLAAHHFTAGDSAAARRHLDRVVANPAPAALRAEALISLAVLSLSDGSWSAGAELLIRALATAGDDPGLRARILVPLSLAELNGGRIEASKSSIDAAVLAATEFGQPQPLSQALDMHVMIDFILGEGVDSEMHSRAITLEQRDPPTWIQLRPTVHEASLLAWTGELEVAHRQFVSIRRDLIERGEESELMFVAFLAVLTDVWRADFGTARAVTDDAVQRAQHLDGWLPLGVALMLRALLDAYSGREEDSRRGVRNADEAIRRSGSIFLLTWHATTLGFLELSLGNHEAVLTTLEPALAAVMANPRGTEIFVAGFLPDAVEAMVYTGRLDGAEAAIDILEGNGRRLERAWMLAVGARCRAMLLAARGEIDAAAATIDRALVEHQRLPMPFERARTLLVLGQIQRRQRSKDTAAATLREALGVFEQLSTPLWADRARAELLRTKAAFSPPAELTSSEWRVAELLASGMTRREVAAALFISPKTVEAHLGRVYRKLDIHSRAELGRYMSRTNS